MLIFAFSAAFVGLVHSLAPGHWIPAVLMAKARHWPLKTALLGASMIASGHILLSSCLALISIWIGSQFFTQHETHIEHYSGLALACFGLFYAGFAYIRHSSCSGHTHHGPEPKPHKTPFIFLFSIGFSPCVAVIPVLGAAASSGIPTLIFTLCAFSMGVLCAILGATVTVSRGLMKLDHPIFEHYGDVLTGLGVTLSGLLLFFI